MSMLPLLFEYQYTNGEIVINNYRLLIHSFLSANSSAAIFSDDSLSEYMFFHH